MKTILLLAQFFFFLNRRYMNSIVDRWEPRKADDGNLRIIIKQVNKLLSRKIIIIITQVNKLLSRKIIIIITQVKSALFQNFLAVPDSAQSAKIGMKWNYRKAKSWTILWHCAFNSADLISKTN